MKTILSGLKKCEMFVVVAFTAAMVAVTFAQVIFRGMLNNPLAWSEEVTRYLFVWIVFIGGAWAVPDDAHFRVNFLLSLTKGLSRRLVVWFSSLCMIVFALVMLVYGISLVSSVASQISPALRISMSIPYLALPLSGLLIIIHAIELALTPTGGNAANK